MKLVKTALENTMSLEFFLKHWKYWVNYEDSTVLVDPSMNIIAFYDRGTSNIDVLSTDVDYYNNYICECFNDDFGRVKINKIPTQKRIKYYPIFIKEGKTLDWCSLVDPYKDRIKEIKSQWLDDDKEKYLIALTRRSCRRHIKWASENYFVNLKRWLIQSIENIEK